METIHENLDRRIDAAGWGMFCLMSGALLLVPQLPNGTWLTSIGALIVGLAALRVKVGLPVSRFWTVFGAGLAALGVATLAGWALPWFAVLMIVCGIGLVAELPVSRLPNA